MGLSDDDVRKRIYKSLAKIEKGDLDESFHLQSFLDMNNISSDSLSDMLKVSFVIGELERSNFIYKKYSSFLMCGLPKHVYDNERFAHDEISHLSDIMSKEHKCMPLVFNDYEGIEDFLMDNFEMLIEKGKASTLVYHCMGKGGKNFSEFVSFKGNVICGGGIAHNWFKSLDMQIFGEKRLISSYAQELSKGTFDNISYMGYGNEVNDVNIGWMPLVDRVLKTAQCYFDKRLKE